MSNLDIGLAMHVHISSIGKATAEYGLIPRGGFCPVAEDAVPAVHQDGELVAAEYVVLVGNAGSAMWEKFQQSAEYQDRQPDPLNRWSRRIGERLAARFAARALFPFDATPPQPFLRWAKRAEGLHNSQLGMLMHPRYGLWHAYRFALAFARAPADAEKNTAPPVENLCVRCETQPCLRACPVDAFTAETYAVQTCANYLHTNLDSECMRGGCRARAACPYNAYTYTPAHAAFHMRAFVDARPKNSSTRA